jgi:hypothetical protein
LVAIVVYVTVAVCRFAVSALAPMLALAKVHVKLFVHPNNMVATRGINHG